MEGGEVGEAHGVGDPKKTIKSFQVPLAIVEYCLIAPITAPVKTPGHAIAGYLLCRTKLTHFESSSFLIVCVTQCFDKFQSKTY
jgi:hypothetical protein